MSNANIVYKPKHDRGNMIKSKTMRTDIRNGKLNKKVEFDTPIMYVLVQFQLFSLLFSPYIAI